MNTAPDEFQHEGVGRVLTTVKIWTAVVCDLVIDDTTLGSWVSTEQERATKCFDPEPSQS